MPNLQPRNTSLYRLSVLLLGSALTITSAQAQNFYVNSFENAAGANSVAEMSQVRVGLQGGTTVTAFNVDGPKDIERAVYTGGVWQDASGNTLNAHAIGAPSAVAAPAGVALGAGGSGVAFFNDWNSGYNYRQQRTILSPARDLNLNPGGAGKTPYVRFTFYHRSNLAAVFPVIRVVAKRPGDAKAITIASIQSSDRGSTVNKWDTVLVPIPPAFRTAATQVGISVVNEKNDAGGGILGTYALNASNIYFDDFKVYDFQPTTITAIASTAWNLGSTWNLNRLPTAEDNVVIPTGIAVPNFGSANNNRYQIQSLTLNGTATFGYNGFTGMHLAGDLTINGTARFFHGGNMLYGGNINMNNPGLAITTLVAANSDAEPGGGIRWWWGGGAPQSLNGPGFFGSNAAKSTSNRLRTLFHLNPAGVTYNANITVTRQFQLGEGPVSADNTSRIVLGGSAQPLASDIVKGRLVTGFANSTSTQFVYTYATLQYVDITPEIVKSGLTLTQSTTFVDGSSRLVIANGANPIVPSLNLGTSALNNNYNNIVTDNPSRVTSITFNRGIVSTDATNLLTLNVALASLDRTPVVPSYVNNITYHQGSYINGPLRYQPTNAVVGTLGYPLGKGAALPAVDGSNNFTATNYAKKISVVSPTNPYTANATYLAALTGVPTSLGGQPVGGSNAVQFTLSNALPLLATVNVPFDGAGTRDNLGSLSGSILLASSPALSGTYTAASASTAYTVATGSITTNVSLNTLGLGYFLAFGRPSCLPGGWTGASSSVPTLGANWCGGTAPATTDNIQINAGAPNYPDFNLSQYSGLTLNGGTANLVGNLLLTGDLVYNGGAFQGNGLLEFNGTGAQSISGTGNGIIPFLRVNKATGILTASTPINVSDSLKMTAGTLAANGNLTLLSNASKTARIGNIVGGSITGNVKVQRYINGAAGGWYFLGSPVAGNTLADWSELGPRVSPANNATAFFYNTTDSTSSVVNGTRINRNGWKVASASEALSAGKGLRVFARSTFLANNKVVDNIGVPNQGNQTIALAYSAGTTGYTGGAGFVGSGWNLLSNPYASAINWNHPGITKPAGLVNSVFIWNGSAGRYEVYVGAGGSAAGISNTLSGGPIIASHQGFMVFTTAVGNLVVREQTKATTTAASFYRAQTENVLRVALTNPTHPERTDYAVLRLIDGATDEADAAYDAPKLDGIYQNVSFDNANGQRLAVSSRNAVLTTLRNKLTATVTQVGSYELSFSGLETFAYGTDLYLLDNYTGSRTALITDKAYAFDVTADLSSQAQGRFEVILEAPAVVTNIKALTGGLSIYPNPATAGSVKVLLPGGQAGQGVISILDATGRLVKSVQANLPISGEGYTLSTDRLQAGVYTVRVQQASGTLVSKLTIQ